jgi:hypothetical protein
MRFFSMLAVLVSAGLVLLSNAAAEGSPVAEWISPLPVLSSNGSAVITPIGNGAGYAVAGSCSSRGYSMTNDLVFLVKTDATGKPTSKVYYYTTFCLQMATGTNDVCAVIEMPDGDIVLTGTCSVEAYNGLSKSAWVMRIDSAGTNLWTTFFGTAAGKAYSMKCATIMKNNDICVGGQEGAVSWAADVGEDGGIRWSNTFEGEKTVALATIKYSSWPGVIATCLSNSGCPETRYFERISLDGAFISSTFSGEAVECPATEGVDPVALPFNDPDNVNSVDVLLAKMNPCTQICQVKLYGDDAILKSDNDFSIGCNNEKVTALGIIGDQECIIGGSRPIGQSWQMWIAGMCKCGKIWWLTTIPTAQTACAIQPVSDHEFIVLSKGAQANINLALTKFDASEPSPTAVAVSSQKNSAAGLTNGTTAVFDVQGRLVSRSRTGHFSRGMYFGRPENAGTSRVLPFEVLQK